MARPPYKPTAAIRRKVAIAAGAGMIHEQIAIALGISEPTLRKHFEIELSVGAYEKRIEVLQAMHAAAKKGNVAAQKAYAAMAQPRVAAPPLPTAELVDEQPEGKKAIAQAAAVKAQDGTDWESLLTVGPVQ